MVDDDQYCPDVMKQLSAIQGQLEGANRLVLRTTSETCVVAAMVAGRTDEIVDELMEALRFDRLTTGPDRTPVERSTSPVTRAETVDLRSADVVEISAAIGGMTCASCAGGLRRHWHTIPAWSTLRSISELRGRP